MKYPKHRLISNNNGMWIAGKGKRKFALMNKYKESGLTPGVSDLFLCVPKGGFSGLWVEMKAKGKTLCSLSDNQKRWLKDMNAVGYKATWCSGADQAIKEIEEYLNLKNQEN